MTSAGLAATEVLQPISIDILEYGNCDFCYSIYATLSHESCYQHYSMGVITPREGILLFCERNMHLLTGNQGMQRT